MHFILTATINIILIAGVFKIIELLAGLYEDCQKAARIARKEK